MATDSDSNARDTVDTIVAAIFTRTLRLIAVSGLWLSRRSLVPLWEYLTSVTGRNFLKLDN